MLFVEGVLNGVQGAGVGQAFDGLDIAAFALHREVGAALDGLAVNVHRAGAAVAGLAADVGAGQAHLFAQEVNQQGTRLHRLFHALAIEGHGHHFFAHGSVSVFIYMRGGLSCNVQPLRRWRAW